MKRKVFLFVVFFILFPSVLSAKSYTVPSLVIDAELLSDSSMKVREKISYEFKGSYSYAFREIPLKPGERIDGIRVSEGIVEYLESEGEEPGSFEVKSSDDVIVVSWYFKARNQVRTFVLDFTIHGAVHRYPDVAELYYKFVGDGWEEPIEEVSVKVQLIEGLPPGSIRAWAHGPLHGTVELREDRTVHLDVAPLPKRTFWEGRILFPESALAGVPLYSQESRRETVLAEEAAWAEEANRRREEAGRQAERTAQLKEQWLPIVIVAPFFGIAFWFFSYFRSGKAHPVRQRYMEGTVPSEHPPALVSYLLHRSVVGEALVITLVDLANRGYLRIVEEVTEKRGWIKARLETDYRFELTARPWDNLLGFERELLEFMLQKAGDSQGFLLSNFKSVARKNRSEFLKWFKSWKKRLESRARDEEFFEPYQMVWILPNVLLGLVLMGIGIGFLVATDSEVGVWPLFAGILQGLLSLALSRRTEKGQELLNTWKDYKKYLKSISKARGPVSLSSAEWGQHIVAAILFGLHEKLAKVMESSDVGGRRVIPLWYVVASGAERPGGVTGFSGAVSSMVTSVSSTMSSASGMGGGASGGGGGGSGGGGGGAG